MIPVTLCTVRSRTSQRKFSGRKRCYQKFHKVYKKTLVPQSLIFLSLSLFLHNASGRLLLQIQVTLCSTYLLNDKSCNMFFLTICFYRLCHVRVIYSCRFADFKLQRNKVESRIFSFAVMYNFDTEFIALLLMAYCIQQAMRYLMRRTPLRRSV